MHTTLTSPPPDRLAESVAGVETRNAGVPSVRLLVGVAVGVAIARWLFAADRVVVHAFPDGFAQLAMARWIAGGTEWSMLDHATWQPGLATLLAPIYWFTDDPGTVYRAAIGVNCLLAGISAALAARLIHRLTRLPERSCVMLAVVVAMLPASISASAYVWAEPLVTLCFLATVLSAMRFVDHPSPSTAYQPIVWSALGYLTHGRLLPMLAVAVLLVVVVAWRRANRRLVGGALTLGVLLLGTVQLYTGMVHRAVWTDPDRTNTVGETLRRLGRPRDLVEWGVGQLWYQLVATAGLFGVGMFVLLRAGIRAGNEPVNGLRPRDVRVLLAFLLPLMALSVLFMAGRPARRSHDLRPLYGCHCLAGDRRCDRVADPGHGDRSAARSRPDDRRRRRRVSLLGARRAPAIR